MSTTGTTNSEAGVDFEVGPAISVECGDQTVELVAYWTDDQGIAFDMSPPEEPIALVSVEPLIAALLELRAKAEAMWPSS